MAPRPDPNPKTYSHREPVAGTGYYKERKLQPGFSGSAQLKPDVVKRKALGQALQNTSRRYGTQGLGVK